jgi:hypothetical protein
MKAIGFGIAFAGVVIGYGIAVHRRDLTECEDTTGSVLLFATFLGICLS